MIENTIKKLMRETGLGEVTCPIEQVSGGFMHRMYKVTSGDRIYAIKHLNSNILKRPEAMANFSRAEELERKLEEADIPIVAALSFNNRKMLQADGEYFYIFNWHNGTVTDWNNITEEQCRKAGNILGKINAIKPECIENENAEESNIDWDTYIKEGKRKNIEVIGLLEENKIVLLQAEKQLNIARKYLPGYRCISNGDMDPKNVMWDEGEPMVIDLECLDYGNPVSHVLQLSLQWAGVVTYNIDVELVRAFFEGYLAAYDNGFREYDKVFGLAYTWLEWLEYNVGRTLDDSIDENEQKMGASEVENTVKRILYINRMEEDIKKALKEV